MYHVSKCGFTSCKTGSKNKKQNKKKPQSKDLEGIFFFNYKNAWLIRGCAEHFKKQTNKQSHLLDDKNESPALWGLKLPRTCGVLSAPQPPRGLWFQGLFRPRQLFLWVPLIGISITLRPIDLRFEVFWCRD